MIQNKNLSNLITDFKKLPAKPGVYLFKDKDDQILYIGKAKNLKKRVASYFQKQDTNKKACAIIESSQKIDFITTKNELEAMLLEAQLIQSNQPKFNILLKTGQLFLYILITTPPKKLPELKIIRNKKEKGVYFGPFLEKTPARKVYDFLIQTFKLKLCKKKIENGCLDYHMGICAGYCRPDFDKNAYIQRLELAKLALKKGHKNFLKHLEQEIEKENKKLNFEKSKELHEYYKAFQNVFESLQTNFSTKSSIKSLGDKDIWILTPDKKVLFVFTEKNSALRKKYAFYFLLDEIRSHPSISRCSTQGERTIKTKITQNPFILNEEIKSRSRTDTNEQLPLKYLTSYYQNHSCPNTILSNFEIKDKKLLEQFLQKWNNPSPQPSYKAPAGTARLRITGNKEHKVTVQQPKSGHFASLIKLAKIHAKQEIKKQKTIPKALKNLLRLDIEPHTIDCFDISHKQGMFMVGSCIRFKDGKPDKDKFRRFKIKTVEHQDDYACLREIVKRRYKNKSELPDLILIDGGKGQLNAVKDLFSEANFISLAKREETVFSVKIPEGKKLNLQTYAGQVLISLRDYAHHFAISYHRKLSKTIKLLQIDK
jgi:excinuclease ABC subunit C